MYARKHQHLFVLLPAYDAGLLLVFFFGVVKH
jgi:hypothetical protein